MKENLLTTFLHFQMYNFYAFKISGTDTNLIMPDPDADLLMSDPDTILYLSCFPTVYPSHSSFCLVCPLCTPDIPLFVLFTRCVPLTPLYLSCLAYVYPWCPSICFVCPLCTTDIPLFVLLTSGVPLTPLFVLFACYVPLTSLYLSCLPAMYPWKPFICLVWPMCTPDAHVCTGICLVGQIAFGFDQIVKFMSNLMAWKNNIIFFNEMESAGMWTGFW